MPADNFNSHKSCLYFFSVPSCSRAEETPMPRISEASHILVIPLERGQMLLCCAQCSCVASLGIGSEMMFISVARK